MSKRTGPKKAIAKAARKKPAATTKKSEERRNQEIDHPIVLTRSVIDKHFTQWPLNIEDIKDMTMCEIVPTNRGEALEQAFADHAAEIINPKSMYPVGSPMDEARKAFEALKKSMLALDDAAETFGEHLGGFRNAFIRLANSQ